jgi:hypothetical protein
MNGFTIRRDNNSVHQHAICYVANGNACASVHNRNWNDKSFMLFAS